MVKKNDGWTLIELLIVVAVLGIVGMMGPQVVKQTVQFFVLGKAKLQLQDEARAAMYILTRELRQAQSSTISIDQASGQPYYSRITFSKVQGTTVTVSQSGSTLTLTEGTITSILSKNLEYLAFTFPRSDDMTIVSVSMTLQEQIYNGFSKALHMASEKVRVMN